MTTKQAPRMPENPAKTAVYASLGAGQLVIEKATRLTGKVKELAQMPPDARTKAAVKMYERLAARGEDLVSGVRRNEYKKAVVEQAQTAGRQVKSATAKGVTATTKTVKKAVDTTAKAAKAATDNIG